MTAEIANGARQCGRCEQVIQAGHAIYLVTRAQLVRCEICARAIGGPLPKPFDMRSTPRPRVQESIAARFSRETVAQTVRKNIVDFRSKAAGSDT